jgi:uncharacterized protein (TIGR02466 family)
MDRFGSKMIFPTTLVISEENYSVTKNEIEFAKNNSLTVQKNAGNTTSLNREVLNDPEMKGISDFINEGIQYYVKNIIDPRENLQFYVTQSWINFTKSAEYHHRHSHPNSIISGVFYINAEKDIDKITFFKPPIYSTIQIPSREPSFVNGDSWWWPVEPGRLIIFASSLEHMVEQTKSTSTRISLSFNVFCKGTIGDKHNLTLLEL